MYSVNCFGTSPSTALARASADDYIYYSKDLAMMKDLAKVLSKRTFTSVRSTHMEKIPKWYELDNVTSCHFWAKS